jgi:L-2-hydroxyglutarate oxidase LhgO
MLYELCESKGIGFKRTGKWIVAQNEAQKGALENIYRFCSEEIGVPVRWVGEAERAASEPHVRAVAGVLESPTTGIIDSHGLMMYLLGGVEESGGVLAVNSEVVGVTPVSSIGAPGSEGWEVQFRDKGTGETSTVTTDTVINSAGLASATIHNMPLPEDRHVRYAFAKGNYFSYGASQPKPKRLIYPAPEPGHGGLGTHLTLDLNGRIRFGPDLEWVDSPDDLTVSSAQLQLAIPAIKTYLPTLDDSALTPDYCGIRPKLSKTSSVTSGVGFADFIIRKEGGLVGWINLLGIESPGLTSSLAIGEMVEKMLY